MTLLISSILKLFYNKIFYNFNNYLLIVCLIIILMFDFSLHIPIIQFLFVIYFSLNNIRTIIMVLLYVCNPLLIIGL